MLDPIYLADIAEKDYAAFLALPGHEFPNTFDEWRKRREDQAMYYRGLGHPIVYVRVDADEFARFCSANNAAHDGNSFSRLIFKKGTRDKK